MERDELPRTQPRDHEAIHNDALARYDKRPGIAVVLLAVMAFLFIVVVYQFASDRVDTVLQRGAALQTPQAPKY
jgi:hypothetical protein